MFVDDLKYGKMTLGAHISCRAPKYICVTCGWKPLKPKKSLISHPFAIARHPVEFAKRWLQT